MTSPDRSDRGAAPGDVLLVVDVLDHFGHRDGDALLSSFRARLPNMSSVLGRARAIGLPVVYANDNHGIWDGDRERLADELGDRGAGPDVVASLRPASGDRFVVKPRYSAFDLTPLPLLLRGLGAGRIVLIGSTTEMCVAQTAIDARERDLKVTVLQDACATVDRYLEQIALTYLERVTGTHLLTSREWLEDPSGRRR